MKKGFTLIELLIVISIIGILAVALLPQVLSAPASARDAAKQSALNSIVVALEQYNAANGQYPAEASCLDGKLDSDTTETALAAYFKSGTAPTVDAAAQQSPSVVSGGTLIYPSTCKTYYYCPLANNRYFVGVAMEKSGTGKGRYSASGDVTCGSSNPSSASLVSVTDKETNVFGVLQ